MILRAQDLRKRFEARWVLRGVDLTLGAGDVLLLGGKNGSGKTTLARILASLLDPDAGSILFDGKPLRGHRRVSRRSIGFATHRPLLYAGLSPLENLTLLARLSGVAAPERRAADLLEALQMTPHARTPVERFSRGMLQRVALARAFLGEPRLLLLDEPHAGLDDDGAAVLREWIGDAAKRGAAVLIVSHDRERLGTLPTRHARMVDGVLTEGA